MHHRTISTTIIKCCLYKRKWQIEKMCTDHPYEVILLLSKLIAANVNLAGIDASAEAPNQATH